jgi:hypothetical protein
MWSTYSEGNKQRHNVKLCDWLSVKLCDWLSVKLSDWLSVKLSDWLNVKLSDWLSFRGKKLTTKAANQKAFDVF